MDTNHTREYFSVKNVALTRANVSQLFQKRAVVEVEQLDDDRIETIREMLIYEGNCERSLRWEREQKEEILLLNASLWEAASTVSTDSAASVRTTSDERGPKEVLSTAKGVPSKNKSRRIRKAKVVKKRHSSSHRIESEISAKKKKPVLVEERQPTVVPTAPAPPELPVLFTDSADPTCFPISHPSFAKVSKGVLGEQVPRVSLKVLAPLFVKVVSTAKSDTVVSSNTESNGTKRVENVKKRHSTVPASVPSKKKKHFPVEERQWEVVSTASSDAKSTVPCADNAESTAHAVLPSNVADVWQTACSDRVSNVVLKAQPTATARTWKVASPAADEVAPVRTASDASRKDGTRKVVSTDTGEAQAPQKKIPKGTKKVKKRPSSTPVPESGLVVNEKPPVLVYERRLTTSAVAETPVLVAEAVAAKRVASMVLRSQPLPPVTVPTSPELVTDPPLVAAPLPLPSVSPPAIVKGPSTAHTVPPPASAKGPSTAHTVPPPASAKGPSTAHTVSPPASAKGPSTAYTVPPPASVKGPSTAHTVPPPASVKGPSTAYTVPPPASVKGPSTAYTVPPPASAKGPSSAHTVPPPASAKGPSTATTVPPPASAKGPSTAYTVPPPASAKGLSTAYTVPPPASAKGPSTATTVPLPASVKGPSTAYTVPPPASVKGPSTANTVPLPASAKGLSTANTVPPPASAKGLSTANSVPPPASAKGLSTANSVPPPASAKGLSTANSVPPPASPKGPSTATAAVRIEQPLVSEIKLEPGTVVEKRAAPSVPLVMIPVGNMPATYRAPKTGTSQSKAASFLVGALAGVPRRASPRRRDVKATADPPIVRPTLTPVVTPTPPPVITPTLTPIVKTTPPLIVTPTPPPIVRTTPPPVARTTPPPVARTTPPSVVRPTPPSVVKTTPSLIVKPTPPPIVRTTPPPVARTTPPPVVTPTPPPVVRPTPPPVVRTTPPSVVRTTPPSVVKTTPSLIVKPTPPSVVTPTPPPVVRPTPPPIVRTTPPPVVTPTPPPVVTPTPPSVVRTTLTPVVTPTLTPVVKTTPPPIVTPTPPPVVKTTPPPIVTPTPPPIVTPTPPPVVTRTLTPVVKTTPPPVVKTTPPPIVTPTPPPVVRTTPPPVVTPTLAPSGAPVPPLKPLIRVRDAASLGIVGRRFSDENTLQSSPALNSVPNRMSPLGGSTLCSNTVSSASVAPVNEHRRPPGASVAAVNERILPPSASVGAVNEQRRPPSASVAVTELRPSASIAAVGEIVRPPSVTFVATYENGLPTNSASFQPGNQPSNSVALFGAPTNQMSNTTQDPLAPGPSTRDAPLHTQPMQNTVDNNDLHNRVNHLAAYFATIWSQLVQLKAVMNQLTGNPNAELLAAFRRHCFELNRTLDAKRPIFVRHLHGLTAALPNGRALLMIASRVRFLLIKHLSLPASFSRDQFDCVYSLIASENRKPLDQYLRVGAQPRPIGGVSTTTAAPPPNATSTNGFHQQPVAAAAAAHSAPTNGYTSNQAAVYVNSTGTDLGNSGMNSSRSVTVHVGARQSNDMHRPVTSSGNCGPVGNGFTFRVVNSQLNSVNTPANDIAGTYAAASSGYPRTSSATGNGYAVNSTTTVDIGTNGSFRALPPAYPSGYHPNPGIASNGNCGNLLSGNGFVGNTSASHNGHSTAPGRIYGQTGERGCYAAATATAQTVPSVDYLETSTPATANGYHQIPTVNATRNLGSGSTITQVNHGSGNHGGYMPAARRQSSYTNQQEASRYQESNAATTIGNQRNIATTANGFPTMANALCNNTVASTTVNGHYKVVHGYDTISSTATTNGNRFSNGVAGTTDTRGNHQLGNMARGNEHQAASALPGVVGNQTVIDLPMPNNAVSMRLSLQTVDSNGTTSFLDLVHNTIPNTIDNNGGRGVASGAKNTQGDLAGANGSGRTLRTANSGSVRVYGPSNGGKYPESSVANPPRDVAQSKNPLLDDLLSGVAPSSNVARPPQSVGGFRASEALSGIAAKAAGVKQAKSERHRAVLSLSQEMNVDKSAANVRSHAKRKKESAHALEQRIEELTRKTSEVVPASHVVIGRQGAGIVEQPAKVRSYLPKSSRSVTAPWMRPPSLGTTAPGEKGDEDAGARDGDVRTSAARAGTERATVIRNPRKDAATPLSPALEVCVECGERSIGLCGACKAFAYCSDTCMTGHWNRIHNKECVSV